MSIRVDIIWPAGRVQRRGKRLQADRREPARAGGMPLVEGRRQRPARRQTLHRQQPLGRLPRLEGLPHYSRLTKNLGRTRRTGQLCVDAPSETRDHFFCSPGHLAERFRVSGLSMRRVDACRWPAWRCADRVHIGAVENPSFLGSWNMMLLRERGEPRHAEAQAAAPAGAVRLRVA